MRIQFVDPPRVGLKKRGKRNETRDRIEAIGSDHGSKRSIDRGVSPFERD